MQHRDEPLSRREQEIAMAGMLHGLKTMESHGIIPPRVWQFECGRFMRLMGFREFDSDVAEISAEVMRTALRISGATAQLESDTLAQAQAEVKPSDFEAGPAPVAPVGNLFHFPGKNKPDPS